jgi:acetolactate synthase-1/2/3 large subunit
MGETYGGDIIGKALKEEGVKYFFGIQGAHMWGLLLGICEQGIQMINMRHEQAGVYAADAYSRLTQSPGVCFGTAGPGMQNMAAGISQAYSTRSPVLALFGQHPTFEDGLKGLQVGWGTDMMRTVTKWTLRILDGNVAGYWIRKALRDILTYPPGPVALDLPPGSTALRFDESRQRYTGWRGPVSHPPAGPADEALVEKAVKILINAEKPIIMGGDGVFWANASAELQELAELLQIPVNTRRMGRGAMPEDHPLAVGGRYRGRLLRDTDAVLIIGHPIGYLENYGQGPPYGTWNMGAKYIQITESPQDLSLMIPTELEIIGNVKTVLRQMIDCAASLVKKAPKKEAWLQYLSESRKASEQRQQQEEQEFQGKSPIHPAVLGREVARFLDESARDATVIFDAFTGTAYFTDRLTARFAGQVLDPAEHGGVGHGIGMGIGAQLARPGKPVLAYMGDLGMGIGAMDIETALRYKLPVVYLVSCNGTGISGVRDLYFSKTKLAGVWDFLPNIRYDKMFEPLGCHAEHVEKPSEIRPALERAFNSGVTSVVNVFTDPDITHPLNLTPLASALLAMLKPEQLPERGRKIIYPDSA